MLKETWIHKDAFGAPKDVVHIHLMYPTPQNCSNPSKNDQIHPLEMNGVSVQWY
jgi:hypothetical protein